MFPAALTTPRLTLRLIGLDDAGPIFHAYGQDLEVARFVTWTPHRTQDSVEAFIRESIAQPPDASRVYAVLGRDDGALRGTLGLTRIRPHHVEFGYALARRWWGQGLMTEALVAVRDWACAQPGIFRLSGFCDVENIGSARVMEKAGLTREGVLRRWIVHPAIGDQPRDCFVYAWVRQTRFVPPVAALAMTGGRE
jgi:RimJ/RimL family protein N-acetyltransferase